MGRYCISAAHLPGGLLGIGIAAIGLVLRNPFRIVDRRLLQRVLVRIVVRLLALGIVGGLARIAVAARVEGIYGAVGLGIFQGFTSGGGG
jgi:hypothetical protein